MKKIAILCCGLLTAAAMQAQIIYVHHDSLRSTIQSGINAANPGDTVLVSEGTYFEQINFLGKKPLIVASQFLIDGDTSHISKTIIDGSQLTNRDSASVVYFVSGEDTTSILCGFTIRGGKGTNNYDYGGLARIGGGIYIYFTGAKIIHNRVTGNIVDDTQEASGLLAIGGGIYSNSNEQQSWVILENNVIDNNKAISKFDIAAAGGFYTCSNARIINNLISDNASTNTMNGLSEGGAGAFDGIIEWGHIAVIRNNHIKNNIAQGETGEYGGVILVAAKGDFSNNEVTGNKALTPPSSTSGGDAGLGLWDPNEGFVVRNNIFKENLSNNYGGGMGIETDLPNPFTVLVENNYFLDNSAVDGGGFYTINNPVMLQNNIFSGNIASSKGGAVYIWNADTIPASHLVEIVNNTFYHNQADTAGVSIYAYNSNPIVFNSIFWQNQGMTGNEIAVENGFVEIAYSDLDTNNIAGNRIIGPGMIKSDPLFSDTSLLTTEHWSTCVDKGVAQYTCAHGQTFQSPQHDILGIFRPVGAGYDMGAYDIMAWGQGVGEISDFGFRISNWPNPVAESTTFSYTLKESMQVNIQVFDSFGQLVAEPLSAYQTKGELQFEWNPVNLPAGIYFYRIQAGDKLGSGKIVKY